MKTRTSFVSNSSSSSFIIAIRGEKNDILKELFVKDDGWIKDLEEDHDKLSQKIKTFKENGFEMFTAEVSYGEEDGSINKFIEKIRADKFEDIKLVYVSC
jgi:hypothetical protein